MKSLPLDIILKVTGGQIIHGSGNPIIKHVLDFSKKEIEDHTLVIHMDHEPIKGKYWKHNKAIVIITDSPDLCTNLGDEIILIQSQHLEEVYWKFIEFYRSLFDIPIIGVTGTCGKTTTKEIIRQMLKKDLNVKATWKSMNSMSVNLRNLTKIDDETDVAVYEMPVAYPGYLSTACRCFKPQVRILLNIGIHHLTGFETPEDYMRAKAEIVDGMDPEQDTLILNADDENIKRMVDVSCLKNVIYFGKSENAHFRFENIRYGNGGMKFTLIHEELSYEAFIPGYGEHNVYNALASIAAATCIGMKIPSALKRIASFEQIEEHLEFKEGLNGCTVIDDTWNSAPLSMTSALRVLKDVSTGKKPIALLGYMPQLGKGAFAQEQYREMGQKAVDADLDLLIVVGEKAKSIGESALERGMAQKQVYFCETGDEVFQVLQPHLQKDAVILIKVTYRVMKQTTFRELRKKLIPEDD
jgi:UDP-N-acetylmuramoyl-tripeptide--D-alanyl-D-alanine ligase